MIARLTNQYIYFDTITVWEEEIVVERFSVENPNSRYIDDSAYQSWDGVYRKYSKKHKRLARPFLAELRLLAKNKNMSLTIIDERGPAEYEPVPVEEITPDFLPGITLKEFQVDAIRKICVAECGLVSITTGGGKCVTGESQILLNGKEMPIDSICGDLAEEETKDVSNFGLFVDGPNGAAEIKQVYKTNKRRVYNLILSTGHTLGGIAEHRVYSQDGWKKLSELECGDQIQVYSAGRDGSSRGRIYDLQAGEANWKEATRTARENTLYKLIVSRLWRTFRDEAQTVHPEGGEIQFDLLPDVFSIEGRIGHSQKQQGIIQKNLGQISITDDDQESYEGFEGMYQSSSDLSGEIRPGISQIQTDNGEEKSGRDKEDQTTTSPNMAPEPCYRAIDKRVVLENAQGSYETYQYEVWKDKLSKQVGTCIHRIVRSIENYIIARSWANHTLCKLLVYIGFSSDNTPSISDNRDQVEILIRDEEGRDLTEEICGTGIRTAAIDGIPLARAEQALRDGFCMSHHWATVKSISERGLENCYDLQVNSESHAYWTNGVLSHNSEIMAAICKAMNCPTAIIAEQIIVIEQLRDRLDLREVCSNPGLFYAGKMPSGELIIIGSIQSLVLPKNKPDKPLKENYKDTKSSTAEQKFKQAQNRYASSLKGYKSRTRKARALHKLIGKCEMILVDEADLATSNTHKSLFRHWFKGRRRLGFTGTPYDECKPVQRLVLNEHLGSVIYQQNRTQVENTGLIVPLEYYMFAFGEDENPKDGSAYDIAMDDWIVYNADFHNLIKAICDKYPDDGTLILVDRHDIGHALNALIPDSQFVYGDTPKKKRPEMLKAFERRDKKVLIGGKNVRRGLDLSGGCENLILATGGKLVSEFDQRLGRARRRNERGKARVFDFLFLCNKYLYAHSRNRLKAAVNMGYKTNIIFRNGTIDGEKFVKSRFHRPRFPIRTN